MHLVIIPLADAQQTQRIPRIGFLQRRAAPTPATSDPLADAFLQGLRDLGYIDGKYIKLEHRYAEGRSDRLPGFRSRGLLGVRVTFARQHPR
jgi:putative ABC transport system substrate-binding protein